MSTLSIIWRWVVQQMTVKSEIYFAGAEISNFSERFRHLNGPFLGLSQNCTKLVGKIKFWENLQKSSWKCQNFKIPIFQQKSKFKKGLNY